MTSLTAILDNFWHHLTPFWVYRIETKFQLCFPFLSVTFVKSSLNVWVQHKNNLILSRKTKLEVFVFFLLFLDSVSKHDPLLVTMTKLLDIFLFREFCKINIDFFGFHLFLLLTCMGLIKKKLFFVTQKNVQNEKAFQSKLDIF